MLSMQEFIDLYIKANQDILTLIEQILESTPQLVEHQD